MGDRETPSSIGVPREITAGRNTWEGEGSSTPSCWTRNSWMNSRDKTVNDRNCVPWGRRIPCRSANREVEIALYERLCFAITHVLHYNILNHIMQQRVTKYFLRKEFAQERNCFDMDIKNDSSNFVIAQNNFFLLHGKNGFVLKF